jgi:hypothetical protein
MVTDLSNKKSLPDSFGPPFHDLVEKTIPPHVNVPLFPTFPSRYQPGVETVERLI